VPTLQKLTTLFLNIFVRVTLKWTPRIFVTTATASSVKPTK